MSLLKIKCLECRAGLKSAAGFTPGQTVCCPKCETYFAVEEPAGEAEEKPKPGKAVKAAVADDDEPRKKNKKPRDDDEFEKRSYKSSPLRYAVLGVLVLVMLVLGYFLYEKKKREREGTTAEPATPDGARALPPGPIPPIDPTGAGMPGPVRPKGNAPKLPKKDGPAAGGPLAGAAADGLLGGTPVPPAEVKRLTEKYTAALVGSWTADLSGGAAEQLTYAADGTYTAARTGPVATTATGRYTVKGLAGTKGLKLLLENGDRPRTIAVVFEEDELHHPSLQPGVTAVFRKK